MKIAIGLPSNRQIRPLTVKSLVEMIANGKEHEFIFLLETEGFTIEDNRNKIALAAKEKQVDYLLFIDDDMVFESNLLPRLLAHNKDIIGVDSLGRNGRRTVKLEGIQGRFVPQSLFSAEVVGTGIMLIKGEVLKTLKPPLFLFERLPNGEVKNGEDVFFCNKARGEGYKIWCDPKLMVKHIGDKLN